MARRTALLLVLTVLASWSPAASSASLTGSPSPPPSCPRAERSLPLPPAEADDRSADQGIPAVPPAAPVPDPAGADYRHRLRPTAHGWPRRDHWCVWIEPIANEGPAARWDQAWADAVTAALARWGEVLALTVVEEPERAQVRVWRRRPPLRGGRASHGRAELRLVLVDRGGEPALEPEVLVSVSPGQRRQAIEATALHELGHAFGLWGHSEDPADAMAVAPGPTPVLGLSARDRATVAWLQRQPGLRLSPELLRRLERRDDRPERDAGSRERAGRAEN